MKFGRALCSLMLIFAPKALFAESAVAKFWNKDVPGSFGCGPGSYVLKSDSWLSTALASSTNQASSVFLPTSSSSKLSGCSGPPLAEQSPIVKFIASNLETIIHDAARGGGQSLSAVANLFGVDQDGQRLFAYKVQQNFNSIFMVKRLQARGVYHSFQQLIAQES